MNWERGGWAFVVLAVMESDLHPRTVCNEANTHAHTLTGTHRAFGRTLTEVCA